MTVFYKVGPGVFTVGAADLAVQAQVTNIRIEPTENVTESDKLELLDGTTLAGDEEATYKFAIAGNLLQDLAVGAIVEWSWINKGTEQPFTFVPNNALARQVSGILVPVPIVIGGDVKVRAQSDFTWRIIGDPALGAVGP